MSVFAATAGVYEELGAFMRNIISPVGLFALVAICLSGVLASRSFRR